MVLRRILLLFTIYLVAVSCGTGGVAINSRTQDSGDCTTGSNPPTFNEEYIIADMSNGNKVFTEYEKYYFKTNKKRNIIIGTPYDAAITKYIWFDNPTGNREEIAIGKCPNAYIDETNNYFICSVPIETKNNIDKKYLLILLV